MPKRGARPGYERRASQMSKAANDPRMSQLIKNLKNGMTIESASAGKLPRVNSVLR